MTELVDIKQEQSEMFFFNAQVDQVDQQTDSYQHCKGLFSSKSRMFGTLNDFHPFIGTSDFSAKKKPASIKTCALMNPKSTFLKEPFQTLTEV